MKILVFGDKGQLGKEIVRLCENKKYEYRGYDIDSLDISEESQVNSAVSQFRPHFIINCAAFNLVDNAETDYDSAFQVNSLGPANIAKAAQNAGAFTIHYGSDYVFDGNKTESYTETDKTNPLNNYGLTKLRGEELLAEITDNYLIFRLSWVYGSGAQNFIFKLRQWAESKSELRIADDEISVPTSVVTIAGITFDAIDNGLKGLYHLTNTGYCSRYQWAMEIMKQTGTGSKLIPVSRHEFNLPANRPGFSAMDNGKISNDLNMTIPDWKYALNDFLSKS